jgi:ribosomal protein S18 acetylase RimI-like enzyme
MKNGFQRLTKEEQIMMSKTLATAFFKHDNFVYLIEDEEKRIQSSYYLFRFMTKVINKYGYIYVVYQNGLPVGYVTFMNDSKAKLGLITILGSGALFQLIRFWLSLSFKERRKYKTYMKVYQKLNHDFEQSIHLYYTGIIPQYKGKGFMKQAMSNALDYFKDLKYQCVTLETSDQGNIGLYKHLGYRVVKSVKSIDERQEIYLFHKDFKETL